ncbi:MAG TPA: hypothetical protein VMJ10_33110 [Kofleriaceae bacterium]|nr:hypothetical protein [Kofleriaceae bacterium]
MARIAWFVLACAVAACSKGGDDSGKQWQSSPPPPKIEVPADVQIAVDVNGQGRPPITTATLDSAKPDFEDIEHRVWLIATLVPEAARSSSAIAATSPTGMSMTLGRPAPDGYEPALFLSRRGELKVAAIDPKDPFPKWHGQGGRLRRPGDALPHVSPVAKLSITTSPTP